METMETAMNNALVQLERKSLATSSRKSKSTSELMELLIDYAPKKLVYICRNEELCYFGNSPTLGRINHEYDPLAAVAFLVPLLTDLAEFSNCKVSFSENQIRSCAEIIAAEYFYMKLSELMLFFYKFKIGEYGQFYGSVSPMVIMCSLRQFARDRHDAIHRHESELRERERERERREWEKHCISSEEYFRPKAKKLTEFFETIISVLYDIVKFNN